MSRNLVRRSRAAARLVALAGAVAVLLLAPSRALAAGPPPEPGSLEQVWVDPVREDGRLHVLEFNVCDRVGVVGAPFDCRRDREDRADYVADYIRNWGSHAAMLQEICQSTYDDVLADLGGAWRGFFQHTYITNDGRCGTNPYWGLAVLSNGSMPSSVTKPVFFTELWGEQRRLLCGNVTLTGIGLKLCSTHLSPPGYQWQVDYIKDETDLVVDTGAALLLGADMNVNNRADPCYPEADKLRDLYTRDYGQGEQACNHNFGHLDDVDNERASGDTFYDEVTIDSGKKLDYIFFNHQRYNISNAGGDTIGSSYSDHRYYRGALTVY